MLVTAAIIAAVTMTMTAAMTVPPLFGHQAVAVKTATTPVSDVSAQVRVPVSATDTVSPSGTGTFTTNGALLVATTVPVESDTFAVAVNVSGLMPGASGVYPTVKIIVAPCAYAAWSNDMLLMLAMICLR
jgi:hypothetical protein